MIVSTREPRDTDRRRWPCPLARIRLPEDDNTILDGRDPFIATLSRVRSTLDWESESLQSVVGGVSGAAVVNTMVAGRE